MRRKDNDTASATFALTILVLLAGCVPEVREETESAESESWSVTAWGERYEVFPEVESLVAGRSSLAHTHITVLEGFVPMAEGSVEIVLRSGAGEERFRADEPVRAGIFNVEITPQAPGEYDLAFLVASPGGREEIKGGRVRVGTEKAPGAVAEAPSPAGSIGSSEPLSFLKEQQWRASFGTEWVASGTLPQSVEGVARVRPPAGGAATITAPVDAVLLPELWPHAGRRVVRGAALFRMVPRIAPERSLATLEAERDSHEAELAVAEARLLRLAGLLEVEATSQSEIEEAENRVNRIAGRLAAAERDLEAAHSAREGGSAGATTVTAPFGGEISVVHASPGEVVAAGAALARLVRTDSVWLEINVSPEAARRVSKGVRGVVLNFPEGASLRVENGSRLVAIAPEVDARTGTVKVLLEIPPSEDLILGTSATAQVLLKEDAEGIVVPATAVVDDGGVMIAYLQLGGESFARQPVKVTARQGKRAIVEGLAIGQRLVTRGGQAIRRSSLLATGKPQGHVH